MSNITVRETELDTMTLGQVLAKSGFFNDTKDAAQAIVKVLAGRELGVGPIASMMGVYIVKGRVTLSANLIGAVIKRSGRYDYRVARLDDQGCEIVFTQLGQEIGRSLFTLDDAKTAGLLGNETWRKFARNMLFARALSNGARWYTPDVFNGPIYTPEELGEAVNEDGEVIAPTPAPRLPAPRPALHVNPTTGEIDTEAGLFDEGDGEAIFDVGSSAAQFEASAQPERPNCLGCGKPAKDSKYGGFYCFDCKRKVD